MRKQAEKGQLDADLTHILINGKLVYKHWSEKEQNDFEKALQNHDNRWADMAKANAVPGRTQKELKTHGLAFKRKLRK